jgi:hypothetical protein
VPAYIAFGVGGLGAVAGGVFGALALVNAGDVKTTCGNNPHCAGVGDAQSKWKTAMASAWISNAGVTVALAGVVTGVVLLVRASSPRAQRAAQSAVGPGGLTIHF